MTTSADRADAGVSTGPAGAGPGADVVRPASTNVHTGAAAAGAGSGPSAGVSTTPSGRPGLSEVTFRFRADAAAVVELHVTWPCPATGPNGVRLRPDPAQPGWLQTTVTVEEDACFSYGYLVSTDPTAPPPYDLADRLIADPGNTDVIPHPFGAASTLSVVTLPGARRRPEHPGTPASTLTDTATARGRRLRLSAGSTPPGQPRTTVLYLDGDVWAEPRFGHLAAVDAHRATHAAAAAADAVYLSTADRAVLADRAEMSRILDDVLSVLEECAGGAPNRLIVVGQSYGALAAAGLAVDRADAVVAAVLQSGSYWFRGDEVRGADYDYALPGTLTAQLAATAGSPERTTRLVVQAGSWETDMYRLSEAFAYTARAAGYPVTLRQYTGGHDYAWYRQAVFDALDELW